MIAEEAANAPREQPLLWRSRATIKAQSDMFALVDPQTAEAVRLLVVSDLRDGKLAVDRDLAIRAAARIGDRPRPRTNHSQRDRNV